MKTAFNIHSFFICIGPRRSI